MAEFTKVSAGCICTGPHAMNKPHLVGEGNQSFLIFSSWDGLMNLYKEKLAKMRESNVALNFMLRIYHHKCRVRVKGSLNSEHAVCNISSSIADIFSRHQYFTNMYL